MIKVLFFEIDKSFGGIESFLLNLISNIDLNAQNLEFDFISSVAETEFENVCKKYGVNVIHTVSKKKILKYASDLDRLFQEKHYDMVHIQKNSLCNLIPIYIADKNKVPYILHAQNSAVSHKNFILTFIHHINKFFFKSVPYCKIACGELAAKWMFKKVEDVVYIKNGINPDEFALDLNLRKDFRKKLKIESGLVICNVGRFTEQKNHGFIIEIFNEVKKIIADSELLLVGDGPKMEAMKEKVSKLKLDDSVIFCGSLPREKERVILMASDIFLLPSLYEGVSIASIEAQMAGLTLFVSDSVDISTDVTGKVQFMSLGDKPLKWAECIVNEFNSNKEPYDNLSTSQSIKRAGYDMKDTTEWLVELYGSNIVNKRTEYECKNK